MFFNPYLTITGSLITKDGILQTVEEFATRNENAQKGSFIELTITQLIIIMA